MKDKEVELLEQLKNDPDATLVKLYRKYRREYFSWVYKTYGAGEDDASDSFQDAMIVLYNNVRDGKLAVLNSSIKTYLFSIGKNVLLTRFKSTQREVLLNTDNYNNTGDENFVIPELYEGNTLENRVAKIIQQLGDPCKSILRYFYFRGLNMEEIADKMNYKNAQTVKSQKVRCIKEMQQLLKKYKG